MFNQKLFFFIFVLLFGKVDNEPNCDDWYLQFPTQFQCEEFYRRLTTSTTKTTMTTTETTTTISTTRVIHKPTSTSSTTETSVDDFVPTILPEIQTPDEYQTEISTAISTTPTTTEFVPTLSEPTTAYHDEFTTEEHLTITIVTTTFISTTTSFATNSARNKTPWYMSLWAFVAYGILAVFFVSGLGVAVFQRARRIRIQASYGRLHGGIQMDPIIEDDEENSSQGSSGDPENPDVTESTLVAPPSQVSSLTFVNPRYRRASTSLHSSDESLDFQSANSSNLVSTRNETQVSVTVHQSPERQSPAAAPRLPALEPVSPIQLSLNLPPPSEESPATEPSPRASTPTNLAERVRDVRRSRQRSQTSKNDPTRRQPSRKAKQNVSYKE